MGEQGVRPISKRPRHPGSDMVRSLGLVGVVLVLWLVVSHPRPPERPPVDWQSVAQSAAASAQYEVVAPPASFAWQATAASVEGQPDGTLEWRAGFLDPDGTFASVLQRGAFPEQARQAADDWLAEATRNGEPEQTQAIAGQAWTRMTGDTVPDERRSLVSRASGTFTVVTGTASWERLTELAATLQPVTLSDEGLPGA